MFNIISAKHPIIVSEFSFDAIDFMTLNLTWKLHDNSTLVQFYKINVTKKANPSNVMLFTTNFTNIKISNLMKNSKYSVTVQGLNFIGEQSVISYPIHFILDGKLICIKKV